MENEKMSLRGTRPCARIHSPMRICQPVSPSPSRVRMPSSLAKINTSGVRNARSVSDGIQRISGLCLALVIES